MRRHLFWDKRVLGGVEEKGKGRTWPWSESAPY